MHVLRKDDRKEQYGLPVSVQTEHRGCPAYTGIVFVNQVNTSAVSHYIKNLIREGEHQQLDFKFEITDSRKIARTLVAFANTDGGKLLIGVKDNGSVVGVRSDEEYYMVEAAAHMYCKPEVGFTTKEWKIDGKTVMEVTIPKSDLRPHSAPYKNGKYKVYIRVRDKNLLANSILLKVWEREKNKKGVLVRYRKEEEFLLKYLEENEHITFSGFCKKGGTSRYKAKNILVNFILLGIIEVIFTEKQTFYKLTKN